MDFVTCDGVGGPSGAPAVILSLLCSDGVGGLHLQIHICFEHDSQKNSVTVF